MTVPTETALREPLAGEEQQALLQALRRNFQLLSELAIRYEVETRPERPVDMPGVYRPESVVELVGGEMARLAQEQVRVLLLDRQNRVAGQRVIYQGNGYGALVRPAEVFRPAVVAAAPHLVLAHNHPSGDPEPSQADISLSQELAEAGRLLRVELLDHVVIGAEGWVSLKARGLIA